MADPGTPAPAPKSAPKFDPARARKDISWIGARLREPSTYAGLGALFALVNLNVDPGVIKDISMIGMGAGGLIAFLLPER
jgi:hypothetical protein